MWLLVLFIHVLFKACYHKSVLNLLRSAEPLLCNDFIIIIMCVVQGHIYIYTCIICYIEFPYVISFATEKLNKQLCNNCFRILRVL